MSEKEQVQGRMSEYSMTVITSVLISGVISVGLAAYGYYRVGQLQPVAVDIQKVIVEEITNTSKMTLDEKGRQGRAQAFSGALEKALDEAGGGKRLVIVGPAALRGAQDVTAAVQESIRRQMTGG